jgi:hypothetical protein
MELGKGSKLICINDTFDPWVHDLYAQLPKKGRVYTVRNIDIGRTNPKFEVDESQDHCPLKLTRAKFCGIVWLEELVNGIDPYQAIKGELGFNLERFAPPDYIVEEVKETVKVTLRDKELQPA